MITISRLLTCVLVFISMPSWQIALAQQQEIPELLKPWDGWVTWGETHQNCPTPYNKADEHICFWPSRLSLDFEASGGTWEIKVQAFEKTWVPLPGSSDQWPLAVRANGDEIAVMERDAVPSVKLPPGTHQLTGEFHWDAMPQKIAVPRAVGIVALVADGEVVSNPSWDGDGNLWVRRLRAEPATEDHLAVQIYRLLEDGIPLWLHTKVELTVSGKSREEQIGSILPQGWQLSSVESPIPVAVGDEGQLKAQVRTGKWTINIEAFRATDAKEIRFAPNAEPATTTELIGYQAKPSFRIAEIEGLTPVDVALTTFPTEWRNVPVYSWNSNTPFQLVEKMRGLELQRPEGLRISRHLWLDENGGGFTYLDNIRGKMQQIWRLDVVDDQELGAIRVDGEPQLITANPQTGAPGVEIRERNLNLEAIGRVPRSSDMSTTGWQTDADAVDVMISLPPGWRILALFGADSAAGDWLSAWSLLDLFLLLVFALAVGRLWGFVAGVVALFAFGLAYHEPYAPRYTWLFLLMPVALLRVAGEGAARRRLLVWKYFTAALLILSLVPFVARQVQSVIYPQLESAGLTYKTRPVFWWWGDVVREGMRTVSRAYEPAAPAARGETLAARQKVSNLQFDPNAKIQTGPAVPEWEWNYVRCSWSSPVAADQQFRPVFVPLATNRVITVARLVLLVILTAIVFGVRKVKIPAKKQTSAAIFVLLALLPSQAFAQIPGQEMLDELRARLLEPSDAYPHAAEIPQATLRINGNQVTMEFEIHAALDVAAPLPGRLPEWSPLSVKIDGESDAVVCRREGYLWMTVPKGVHHVTVEGMLADISEWEWSYLLKPRQVSIETPGWTVAGVGRDGVPEQQVIISRQRESTAGEATYDQKSFQAIVAVQRRLEIGLVWKVHSVVTRLSAPGKAVSLQVPLIEGENVLSSNAVVENGSLAVRLGANQQNMSWESELPIVEALHLQAASTDQWVERWQLVTSPVWNVAIEGLTPIFETNEEKLVPAWHPWPGEEVTLSFARPDAIQGQTITVRHVDHEVSLGSRQRTEDLKLEIECSLASDFAMELDPEAEVTSLKLDNRVLPVRRDGERLIVSLRPGKQTLEIAARSAEPLQTVATINPIGMPVETSNVSTVVNVPANRWILWAHGPLMGPAVRFWTVLACAILLALVLGFLPHSPLRRYEWVLLALGLTQVHAVAGLWVVAWLFLLAWRGRQEPAGMKTWRFDLLQICLVFISVVALAILVTVVSKGLLGSPEMFIMGNGSWRTHLQWYQGRVEDLLPEPYIVSISVWFYRLLMLAWALWLASALLRWLRWGWSQFSHGGGWKRIFKRRKAHEVANA